MVRHELDGIPYTVHILMKPSDKIDPVNQHYNDDHVGIVYNFSSPTPRSGNVTCQNCNTQIEAKALTTGSVPITGALIQRVRDDGYDLDSMEKEKVVDFLKANLDWRVTVVCQPSFSLALQQ